MPFGGYFDEYYFEIYKPAIEGVGLIPKRVDESHLSAQIVDQIWNNIKQCQLLFADLTKGNQNVFYELGLTHAINKLVVMLTGNIDKALFDVSGTRRIEYDTKKARWRKRLQKKIKML